jgi:hypothetical protein
LRCGACSRPAVHRRLEAFRDRIAPLLDTLTGSPSTGWAAFSDDQAYRAMDFLLDALEEIAAEVFAAVAHLLNLDLDIVFVDTTSTYRCRRGRSSSAPEPRPG